MGSIQEDIVCNVLCFFRELAQLCLEDVCTLSEAMQAEDAQLLL